MLKWQLTFSRSLKHLSIWRTFVDESESESESALPVTFKHLLHDTTDGRKTRHEISLKIPIPFDTTNTTRNNTNATICKAWKVKISLLAA